MINNIGSYLLASSYSATYPLLNTASSVCTINGQSVPCGSGIPSGILAFLGAYMFVSFLIGILMLISYWIVYKKAGRPGWAAIIPIYNIVILLEIVGKPVWWIFLLFIPIVNIIFAIKIAHNLSKSFGQDVGFTIGLIFLPFIFYPLLAFGKYSYIRTTPIEAPAVTITPQAPTSTTV